MWRRWLIEKLGGYATADDAIASVGGYLTIEDAINDIRRKDDAEERRKILTMAVKKLFNTIGPDDILKPGGGGQWMLEGRPLSKGQVEALIAEAAMIQQSRIWRVLEKDVLYQVNRKMFLLSESDLHVVTSKFWQYTFDTIRTRLESIALQSPLFGKKK